MGSLKPRHERFCRQFIECTNATVAAKAAGYRPSSARNAGYRLLRQPQILGRIIELQEESAQTHCRSVDVLLGKLETIYRRAVDDHQLGAAARAVELQAKLSGVERRGGANHRPRDPEQDESPDQGPRQDRAMDAEIAVSYTHLTLPTSDLV